MAFLVMFQRKALGAENNIQKGEKGPLVGPRMMELIVIFKSCGREKKELLQMTQLNFCLTELSFQFSHKGLLGFAYQQSPLNVCFHSPSII